MTEQQDEKRQVQRGRALKGGRILTGLGSASVDCTIRNLSPGGARLTVENSLGVPEQFTLVMADGMRLRCAVRWRKLKDIGVAFVEGDRPAD